MDWQIFNFFFTILILKKMKYFKFSSKLFAFLFMSTILITSCNKDETKNDFSNEITTTRASGIKCNDAVSDARIQFGKILYKSMVENVQITNFVKTKMIEEYNTYYSFLYIKERNVIVHSGKTFEQLLIEASGFSKSQIDDIICKEPLLTISMSDGDNVNVTNWTNTLPGIASIKECDDSRYVLFNNVSPNGVELTTDPKNPTINIIGSEVYYLVKPNGVTSKTKKIDEYMPSGLRISSILNCTNFTGAMANTTTNTFNICGNTFKLFYHDEILQMYIECFNLGDPNLGPGGPGGGNGPFGGNSGGGSGCNKPCERDCETLDETLVNFRILNWGVYKMIANKFWEVKFVFHGDVLAARDYSNGAAVPHKATYVSGVRKRGDLLDCSGVCTGKWQPANYRIWTDWDMANFGSPYYIDWSEEDNGTQTAGISFPLVAKFKVGPVEASAGVTLSISQTSSSTVKLGNAPVFYCDPIMRVNNTGSLEFRCN